MASQKKSLFRSMNLHSSIPKAPIQSSISGRSSQLTSISSGSWISPYFLHDFTHGKSTIFSMDFPATARPHAVGLAGPVSGAQRCPNGAPALVPEVGAGAVRARGVAQSSIEMGNRCLTILFFYLL